MEKIKFKIGDVIINPIGELWQVDSMDAKNYQVTRKSDNFKCYFPIKDEELWELAESWESNF